MRVCILCVCVPVCVRLPVGLQGVHETACSALVISVEQKVLCLCQQRENADLLDSLHHCSAPPPNDFPLTSIYLALFSLYAAI